MPDGVVVAAEPVVVKAVVHVCDTKSVAFEVV